MITVRRRYDSINRERAHEEKVLKDLETEREKYRIEKETYESNKNESQKKTKNLEEELARLRNLCE